MHEPTTFRPRQTTASERSSCGMSRPTPYARAHRQPSLAHIGLRHSEGRLVINTLPRSPCGRDRQRQAAPRGSGIQARRCARAPLAICRIAVRQKRARVSAHTPSRSVYVLQRAAEFEAGAGPTSSRPPLRRSNTPARAGRRHAHGGFPCRRQPPAESHASVARAQQESMQSPLVACRAPPALHACNTLRIAADPDSVSRKMRADPPSEACTRQGLWPAIRQAATPASVRRGFRSPVNVNLELLTFVNLKLPTFGERNPK